MNNVQQSHQIKIVPILFFWGTLMKISCLVLLFFVLAFGGRSNAQDSQYNSSVVNSTDPKNADVYLNVARLEVDLIQLIVEKLNVSLDLDLKVANLVTLTAGVDAYIEKVNLTISGVYAQAELIVRLDNVVKIVDSTLDTINKNPQLITGLLDAVGGLLGDIAGILNSTLNSLGQVLQTVVDATGNIIARTLDTAGNVISQTIMGNVNALQIITSATNSLGQYVTRVRSSDGSILDVTYNKPGGTVISVNVVQQGSTSTGSSSTTTTSPPPTTASGTTGGTAGTTAGTGTTDGTTAGTGTTDGTTAGTTTA